MESAITASFKNKDTEKSRKLTKFSLECRILDKEREKRNVQIMSVNSSVISERVQCHELS